MLLKKKKGLYEICCTLLHYCTITLLHYYISPQSSQTTLTCTEGLLEVSGTSRDSNWNLHCWGYDCFARPSPNI